jgi:resuscitation-promoting factor RpfA
MAMTPGPDMEHDPQLAALYSAGADAAPPAHLDDAIRAAARREVAAGPRRSGARRWAVPVSLAAVLVLSVSVVTMMREQGADRPESIMPPPEIPAPAAERAAPPAATVAVPDATPKRRVGTPPVVAQADPAAKAEVSAPAPVVTGRVAEAERGAAEPRAKAMAAESSRAEDAPAARREYAAPQPMLRSAPAPATMADAGSAGASAAKPAAPAALSAAPAQSALWQDLVLEPPEKWLQRIAELRRAGKIADADTLTTEFRRRFPDQRLPEDLR